MEREDTAKVDTRNVVFFEREGSMKFLMSSMLGLAMAIFASPVAEASWVTSGTRNLGFSGAQTPKLNFAVWDNTSGASVGAGEINPNSLASNNGDRYAYFYQVRPGSTEISSVTIGAPSDPSGAPPTSGQFAGGNGSGGYSLNYSFPSITDGQTTSSGSTVSAGSATTFAFDMQANQLRSPLLWLTSNLGPELRNATVVGTGGSEVVTVATPVVPVPPALALVGLGLPFARLLKRRKA